MQEEVVTEIFHVDLTDTGADGRLDKSKAIANNVNSIYIFFLYMKILSSINLLLKFYLFGHQARPLLKEIVTEITEEDLLDTRTDKHLDELNTNANNVNSIYISFQI